MQLKIKQVKDLQSSLDAKLNLSGGTMTGTLTLNADPSNSLEAATKQYVDSQASGVGIQSIDGVSNDGGNVDLVSSNAISITPDDAGDQITISETHSGLTNNPHGVTKSQVGLGNVTNNEQVVDLGSTPGILTDTEANKPAAGTSGRIFIASDTPDIQRDTGSAWETIGNSVRSVFGRFGDITPQTSDYDASQIDNDSTVSGTTVKAALDNVITTGANIGTGTNLFKQKSGHELQFYGITNGTGMSSTFINGNDNIVVRVDAGTSANQIVQLNGSGELPAVPGINLTSLDYEALSLPQDNIYVGNPQGYPDTVAKSSVPLSDFGSPTADINIGNYAIKTTSNIFNDDELVPKKYVDGLQQGVSWKESVAVATTGNIDLNSAPSTIDGYSPSAPTDRILVKNQTDPTENGIYEYPGAGLTMARTDDADIGQELEGAAVFVQQGDTHADQGWIQTNDNIAVGTDNINWTQFTGLGNITAGSGLSKTDNTLNANTDGTTTTVISDQIAVRSSNSPNQVLTSSGTAGSAAVWGAVNLEDGSNAVSGQLAVGNGGTGLDAIGPNQIIHGTNLGAFTSVTLNSGEILGNSGNGIEALTPSQILNIIDRNYSMEIANARNGSMTLITLSGTPEEAGTVIVTYNGVQLQKNDDYTISGGNIVEATVSLNEDYGGSSSDGQGFASDDTVIAYYYN